MRSGNETVHSYVRVCRHLQEPAKKPSISSIGFSVSMPGWQRTFDSLISTTRIRTLCLGAVLLGVLLVFYFTRTRNDSSDSAPKSPKVEAVQHQIAPLKLAAMSSRHSEQHTLNLKGLDLTHPAIPDAITKLKEKMSVTEHTLKIEGTDVFYREALPDGTPKQQVLLLHGAAFSSETWLKLGTLQYLSAMGHRVVAIDIPGYGQSTGSPRHKQAFMTQLVSMLHLSQPVIISPSMSGSFSLPYLSTHPGDIKGFIPVAPVMSGNFINKYPNIKTPTVIVYGDQDHNLGVESLKNLSLLPNHVVVQLKDAKHPAYLQQPEVWHTILHNFLQKL